MMKQKSIFPSFIEILIGLLVCALGALSAVRGHHYCAETNLNGRGIVLYIIAGLLAAYTVFTGIIGDIMVAVPCL